MPRLARLVFAAPAAATPDCASAPASAQAAPRQASPRVMRVGFAPSRPTGSAVLGSLAATTQLGLTVALSPRDPAALQSDAEAVSTPGKPLPPLCRSSLTHDSWPNGR